MKIFSIITILDFLNRKSRRTLPSNIPGSADRNNDVSLLLYKFTSVIVRVEIFGLTSDSGRRLDVLFDSVGHDVAFTGMCSFDVAESKNHSFSYE